MAEPITADDIRRCHVRETMHGHGKGGMYVYQHVVVEHPRMRRGIRCMGRGQGETVTWTVDGREYADLTAAAAALNEPHDLAGIADRLKGQHYGSCSVEFLGGRLIVTGETDRRCALLYKSFPEFEGVPIEWRPAPPGALPEGEQGTPTDKL